MKKILTASLVAMMAVSAANADIASTNFVNKSIGDEIGKLDADTVGETGWYVKTVAQTNGQLEAEAEEFETSIKKIDEANPETSLVAPTAKAVYDFVDTELGILNQGMTGVEGDIAELQEQLAEGGATKEAIDAAQDAADKAQATADKAVVANTAIEAGTATKITYDSKGLVTKGEALVESDIPTLSASKITNLGTITAANMGTTATTVVGAIKEVAKEAADAQETADKAVVANADITAGTGTKITYDKKGLVTGSENLIESDIPTLSQGKISGLSDSLAAKLDKAALTNATKAGTGETNTTADGTYTLTMKVSNGNQTYIWEKIGR